MAVKIKVIAGVRKGNFMPFEHTTLEIVAEKVGKATGFKYLSCMGEDKKTHFIGTEELCALSEDNPNAKILQKAAGKLANIDDDASLNTESEIGRDADGLLYVV